MLILPDKRLSLVESLDIDYSNPLTRGIGMIHNGRKARIIKGRPALIKVGSPTVNATSKGRSYHFNGAEALRFATCVTGSTPTGATFFALARTTDDVNIDYGLVGVSRSSATAPLIRLGAKVAATAGWTFQFRGDGGVGASTAITDPDIVAGEWVFLVGVYRAGTGQKELWRDGRLIGTDATSIGTVTLDQTDIAVLQRVTPANYFKGAIPLSGIFNRALTKGEIAALSNNPWQLIAKQTRLFYFNAVSSTVEGVAAGTGVATGAAVGASLFSAPAAGVAVATGATVGASLFAGVAAGTAVATGEAVGEGAATDDGVAAGTAVATGAAVGASLFSAPAAGTAVGTGLVVGASLFSAAAAGTAVATGIVISPSAPAVNRTQGSERYAPNPIPRDLEGLIRYLDTELNVIKGFINRLADGHIDMTYVEPVRPRTGDYRLADGSEWDPGSGYGMYVYDGTDWQRLVDVTLVATETQAGIIEIATQAEANTGTDDARAITPLKLMTIITEQTWDG